MVVVIIGDIFRTQYSTVQYSLMDTAVCSVNRRRTEGEKLNLRLTIRGRCFYVRRRYAYVIQ